MEDKIKLVTKKDLEIEWFSAPGPGGQNKNKTKTACRIKHPESGAQAQATKQRSSIQNQREAFNGLTKTPEFKLWLSKKLMEIRTGQSLEERVEQQMSPKLIKVETIVNGQWVTIE